MTQNIWHEDFVYNPVKFTNDWIILKLGYPLDFNEDVYPACLPTSPDWFPETDPNNRCFVSGWGNLEFEGYSPDNLQWVEVPAVTNAVCREESYGPTGWAKSQVPFFSHKKLAHVLSIFFCFSRHLGLI